MRRRLAFYLWLLTPPWLRRLPSRYRAWRFERYVKTHPPIPDAVIPPEMKREIAALWARVMHSPAVPPALRDEITTVIVDIITENKR